MAKEFKHFDTMFSKEEIAETRDRYLNGLSSKVVYDRWDHIDEFFVADTGAIRMAVYIEEGHLEWQRFRVSLKGLGTYNKLKALHEYWLMHVVGNKDNVDRMLQKIRVNNYLGALRRGGQLDEDFVGVK